MAKPVLVPEQSSTHAFGADLHQFLELYEAAYPSEVELSAGTGKGFAIVNILSNFQNMSEVAEQLLLNFSSGRSCQRY